MANLHVVNTKIKAAFPGKDIEAVRGKGYVYFDGNDGFDKIPSLYVHAVTMDTETLTRLCIEQIKSEMENQP